MSITAAGSLVSDADIPSRQGRNSGTVSPSRVTPLFERVFELESLAAVPRLDDVGDTTEAFRERLLAVAEARAS